MGVLKLVTDELAESKFNYKSELLKLVPDIDLVNDYLAVGKTMKRTPTKTGLNLFIKECDRYGLTYELAMTIVIDKNWRGFNYLWLKEEDFTKYGIKKKHPEKTKPLKPISMDETKKIISDAEKVIETKKQINQAFLDYMDELVAPNFASIKFDFLVGEGLISIAENMANYYTKRKEMAKAELLKECSPETALSLPDKRAKELLTKFINDGTSPQIEIRSKQIVLKEYFDAQIKLGKTFIFEL